MENDLKKEYTQENIDAISSNLNIPFAEGELKRKIYDGQIEYNIDYAFLSAEYVKAIKKSIEIGDVIIARWEPCISLPWREESPSAWVRGCGAA